jgi:hypothetical protein
MPVWNSLRNAIGFLYLAPAIFSVPILQTNQIAGVWFSEISMEKNIFYFSGSGRSRGTKVIVMDAGGDIRAISCEIRKGTIFEKVDSESCTAIFPAEGIMIFQSPLFPFPVTLKRVKDPGLIQEVEILIDRAELPADSMESQALAAEIKGSISWDQLHMSVGEFLGWLAKQEKMEEEKRMQEEGQEMKFPFPHREDGDSLSRIKGRWLFNDKRTFVFSDAPAGEAMGVKLYQLEMVDRPGYEGYEPAYTVLVHEEDQRSYLHIVFWQCEFQAPIRIEFPRPGRLLTYHEGMPDAEATKIE